MEQEDQRDKSLQDDETQTDDSTVVEDHDGDGKPEDTGWQKRYKDSQRHITKIEQENKELRSRMDQLTGRFEQIQQTTPKQTEPDWIDSIDDEAIKDDPAKVKELLRRQEAEFVRLLQLRDGAFNERLAALDPSVLSVKDKIDELKKDPDYKGFSDKQLSVIAKKLQSGAPDADERQQAEYRGAPAGGQRPTRKTASTDEDLRKKYAGQLSMLHNQNRSIYGGK